MVGSWIRSAMFSLALASTPAVALAKESPKVAPEKPKVEIIIKNIQGKTHLQLLELLGGEKKVVLDTLASTGIKSKDWVYTPEWRFHIQDKERLHISKKFKVQMPYALRVYKGIYIHQGFTTGNPISHGCIRVPARVAKKIYDMVERGVTVDIQDTDPEHPRWKSVKKVIANTISSLHTIIRGKRAQKSPIQT